MIRIAVTQYKRTNKQSTVQTVRFVSSRLLVSSCNSIDITVSNVYGSTQIKSVLAKSLFLVQTVRVQRSESISSFVLPENGLSPDPILGNSRKFQGLEFMTKFKAVTLDSELR